MSNRPKIKTEAGSSAGTAFGIVIAACAAVIAVMLTVKIGLVLFT